MQLRLLVLQIYFFGAANVAWGRSTLLARCRNETMTAQQKKLASLSVSQISSNSKLNPNPHILDLPITWISPGDRAGEAILLATPRSPLLRTLRGDATLKAYLTDPGDTIYFHRNANEIKRRADNYSRH